MDILQLMDEIEMRHGINEDRWGILRDILGKQAEREAAQQGGQLIGGTPCAICGAVEDGHYLTNHIYIPANR